MMRWVLGLAVILAGLMTGLGQAQTVLGPVPLYYIEFVQPAGASGNATQRVMLYGPDASLPTCLADLQTILGAPAGLGSTAWGWQPAAICYHVP